jgi:hypothetical protein
MRGGSSAWLWRSSLLLRSSLSSRLSLLLLLLQDAKAVTEALEALPEEEAECLRKTLESNGKGSVTAADGTKFTGEALAVWLLLFPCELLYASDWFQMGPGFQAGSCLAPARGL